MSFWPVVKKTVKDADIVLFVLDARLPELSHNANVEYLVNKHNKPYIKVFNKIDLVSRKEVERMRKVYKNAYFVAAKKNLGLASLRKGILIEAKRKGLENPVIGIIGYPNMGKSAIINALSKRSKAKVASIAGTTKGIQWVKAGKLKVLDSPGVVPMEDTELKLGVIGAKNPEKMRKPYKVAYEIIKMFQLLKPEKFEKFYKIKFLEGYDEYDILCEVAKARGYLEKGGEIDENRTIIQIIRDWQSGKLGF